MLPASLVLCAVLLVTHSAHSQNSGQPGGQLQDENTKSNSSLQYISRILNNKNQTSESNLAMISAGKKIISRFVPVISKECEALGYCENVPNYPYEYIEKLIDQVDILKYITRDIFSSRMKEVAQTSGTAYKEDLCPSDLTIVGPQAAMKKNGDWAFILNRKDFRIQGFMYEKCREPRPNNCNTKVIPEPYYKLVCDEKRIEKSMWTMNKQGEVIQEPIPVPLCCSCVLQDNPPNIFFKSLPQVKKNRSIP